MLEKVSAFYMFRTKTWAVYVVCKYVHMLRLHWDMFKGHASSSKCGHYVPVNELLTINKTI